MYRLVVLPCVFFGLLLADHRVRALSNSTFSETPETFVNKTAGDTFWSLILRDCKKLTASCIQKTAFRYLDDTLDYQKDIDLGGLIKLTKNDLDFGKAKHQFAMLSNETKNEGESRDSGDAPLEESSSALKKKLVEFMMTHDMELKLPDVIFDGAVFKISPRSLSNDGAMVKLDMLPKELATTNGQPRIFFKKLSKYTVSRPRGKPPSKIYTPESHFLFKSHRIPRNSSSCLYT